MSIEELEPTEQNEPVVGLAELVAMKRIPDTHAFPLKLYVGDKDGKMQKPLSEWDEAHKEMMSKPTDMSKEAWHEACKNSK